MGNNYLSFLMGGENVLDQQLTDLGVEIVGKDQDGDRKLKIPTEKLDQYLELIRNGLTPSFWNEIVGEKEIIFIFKFKDGHIQEYKLSTENEKDIDKLCAEFNNEPPEKTQNVYKYLSENKFYHDFMVEHYADLINRS